MEVDKKKKEIRTAFMTRIKFYQKENTFCFPDVEDTGRIENAVLPQGFLNFVRRAALSSCKQNSRPLDDANKTQTLSY